MRGAIIITLGLALAACSANKAEQASHAETTGARTASADDRRAVDAMVNDPKVSYQALQAEALRRNVELTPDELTTKQIQDASDIKADPSLIHTKG